MSYGGVPTYSLGRSTPVQSLDRRDQLDVKARLSFSSAKSPVTKRSLMNQNFGGVSSPLKSRYHGNSRSIGDYHMSRQNPDVLDQMYSPEADTQENHTQPFRTGDLGGLRYPAMGSSAVGNFNGHFSPAGPLVPGDTTPSQISYLRQVLKARRSQSTSPSSLVQLAARSGVGQGLGRLLKRGLGGGGVATVRLAGVTQGSREGQEVERREGEHHGNQLSNGLDQRHQDPCDKEVVLSALRQRRKRWATPVSEDSLMVLPTSNSTTTLPPMAKRSRRDEEESPVVMEEPMVVGTEPATRKRSYTGTQPIPTPAVKRSKVKVRHISSNALSLGEVECDDEEEEEEEGVGQEAGSGFVNRSTESRKSDAPIDISNLNSGGSGSRTRTPPINSWRHGSRNRTPPILIDEVELQRKREESLSALKAVFMTSSEENKPDPSRRKLPIFCATGAKPHLPSPLSSNHTVTKEDLEKDREASAARLKAFLEADDEPDGGTSSTSTSLASQQLKLGLAKVASTAALSSSATTGSTSTLSLKSTLLPSIATSGPTGIGVGGTSKSAVPALSALKTQAPTSSLPATLPVSTTATKSLSGKNVSFAPLPTFTTLSSQHTSQTGVSSPLQPLTSGVSVTPVTGVTLSQVPLQGGVSQASQQGGPLQAVAKSIPLKSASLSNSTNSTLQLSGLTNPSSSQAPTAPSFNIQQPGKTGLTTSQAPTFTLGPQQPGVTGLTGPTSQAPTLTLGTQQPGLTGPTSQAPTLTLGTQQPGLTGPASQAPTLTLGTQQPGVAGPTSQAPTLTLGPQQHGIAGLRTSQAPTGTQQPGITGLTGPATSQAPTLTLGTQPNTLGLQPASQQSLFQLNTASNQTPKFDFKVPVSAASQPTTSAAAPPTQQAPPTTTASTFSFKLPQSTTMQNASLNIFNQDVKVPTTQPSQQPASIFGVGLASQLNAPSLSSQPQQPAIFAPKTSTAPQVQLPSQQASIFGGQQQQAQASLFGGQTSQASQQASIFSGQTSQQTSIFGGQQAGQAMASAQNNMSIFAGLSSQPSGQAQLSAKTSGQQSSLISLSNTQAPKLSLFNAASQAPAQPSLFNLSTQASAQPSLFNPQTTSAQSSIFPASTQASQQFTFGKAPPQFNFAAQTAGTSQSTIGNSQTVPQFNFGGGTGRSGLFNTSSTGQQQQQQQQTLTLPTNNLFAAGQALFGKGSNPSAVNFSGEQRGAGGGVGGTGGQQQPSFQFGGSGIMGAGQSATSQQPKANMFDFSSGSKLGINSPAGNTSNIFAPGLSTGSPLTFGGSEPGTPSRKSVRARRRRGK